MTLKLVVSETMKKINKQTVYLYLFTGFSNSTCTSDDADEVVGNRKRRRRMDKNKHANRKKVRYFLKIISRLHCIVISRIRVQRKSVSGLRDHPWRENPMQYLHENKIFAFPPVLSTPRETKICNLDDYIIQTESTPVTSLFLTFCH